MKHKWEFFTITGSILLFTLACATLAPPPESTVFPTGTQEPTPTFTPTPTESPLTATPEEKSEIAIENQADGTTLFTDHIGGYQLIFPENWGTMDLTEGKTDNIFDSFKESNPEISPIMLNTATQLLTEKTHFLTLDTNTGHYGSDYLTAAYSVLDEQSGNFPLEFMVEATVQTVSQQLPNAEIVS